MKSPLALLKSLLLTLCLVLQGPSVMAGVGGSDAVFTMELCVDGAVKTVVIDADGKPVRDNAGCIDCLICCHTTAVPPVLTGGVVLRMVPLGNMIDLAATGAAIYHSSQTRPFPRGPPKRHAFVPISAKTLLPITMIHGEKTREPGRTLFKDATA